MDNQNRAAFFRFGQMLVDAILVNLGVVFSFWLRFGGIIPAENFGDYISILPWITLSALLLLQFYGLYSTYRKRWAEIFSSLICVIFFLSLISMALSFMTRGFAFPRTVLLLTPVLQMVLLGSWRRLAWQWERSICGRRRVMVVGPYGEAAAMAGKLSRAFGDMVRVTGLIVAREDEQAKETGDSGAEVAAAGENKVNYPVLGIFADYGTCLEAANPQEIYICSSVGREYKSSFLHLGLEQHRQVYLVPDFYEVLLFQARVEQVDDVPVFAVGGLAIPEELKVFKRFMDIVLAGIALAITAPLFAVIAAVVRLESTGPVFYRQRRLTEQGRCFYLYKFRTMIKDAEKLSGPVLAEENDSRITRVGKLLRSVRLDELPQLINVLKGEMSIVGPRPERPFFADQFVNETPEYAYRLSVKSGITGLAQVAGKYSTSYQDKLKYDLLYAKRYSPVKDLAILFQTVKVLLMKDRTS
jgi:exopolysaccharide biosynthesis polyprenyl glycosylphosphotransferase